MKNKKIVALLGILLAGGRDPRGAVRAVSTCALAAVVAAGVTAAVAATARSRCRREGGSSVGSCSGGGACTSSGLLSCRFSAATDRGSR